MVEVQSWLITGTLCVALYVATSWHSVSPTHGPMQKAMCAGDLPHCDDLFEGTTKDTYHIPGYCGHIAASKRNPDVLLHSEAEIARENGTSLRLYHRHNVPGYTGHQPTNARNDLGERLSGAHPATTSGAAALGLVL